MNTNRMNIEEIHNEWATDAKIDKSKLDDVSSVIDELHAKYTKQLTMTTMQIIKLEGLEKRLFIKKKLYYDGKADVDEYKKKPLDFKILKGDIGKFVDADDDMVKLQGIIGEEHIKRQLIESIIKQISYRSMNIRNIVGYLNFINGQFA